MKNEFFNRKMIVVIALCLTMPLHLTAQTATITGIVSDKEEPVTGVSVLLKGTVTGTITDIDGKYTIRVNNPKTDVLVFSYVGYNTQEIVIAGKTVINIQLQENVHELDELVVVGYGVQKKSHLTGSITKIIGETLLDIPASDVTTALQGRLSGVNISNLTSEVGVAPEIRVRGIGSISADASPLMVIDGYPVEDGLQMINPNDIASMEVLKDASSAAIYGSRAANGVIMITTKSGDAQKPKYTLRAYGGVKSAYKLHPMMSYNDYVNNVLSNYWEANNRSASTRYNDLAAAWLENQLGKTDWQQLGLQDAYTVNAQLSLSGGKDAVKYYISAGYVKDDGLIIQNHSDKFNTRIKLDTKLSKQMKMGVNLSATYGESSRPRNNFIDYPRFPYWIPERHNELTASITGRPAGSFAQPRDFNITSAVYPIAIVKDANGNWAPDLNPDGTQKRVGANPYNSQNNNPYSITESFYQEAKSYQGIGNIYFDWELMPDLIFRTSDGFSARYQPALRYIYANGSKDGEAAQGLSTQKMSVNWLTENTLTWLKTIGKHDFNILAGLTAEKTTLDTYSMTGFGFPTDYVYTLNAATEFGLLDANGNMATGSRRDVKTMVSFLGRVNYSYADRYLLSVAVRMDGSSLFGSARRWAAFPSVSAGWRVSEEPCMKNADWISQLKLRLSYGVTGNNNIPYNANTNVLKGSNYPFGAGTGTLTTGLAYSGETYGNEYLTWEQTEEWNAGFDFGIIKNRVTLTLDAYYAKTRSLLFERPMQSLTGLTKSWANIGQARNEGLEFTLDTHNINNKVFKWTTNANIAFTRNRLLELGGEQQIITKGYNKERYINRVGDPAIQFYGFRTKGVIQSIEDPDNPGTYRMEDGVPYYSDVYTQPGQLYIVDQDDNGIIDDRDLTVIGNPYPDFTYGMTNTFTYKGWELSFLIQGVQGGSIVNAEMTYNDMFRRNANYHPEQSWMANSLQGDGKHPNIYGSGYDNWILTDYAIQDASYACLRNVTVGYTFSKKTLKKLNLSKLRIYATGNNLCYLTSDGYWGINPEYRNKTGEYTNPLIGGYQRGAFPLISTYTIGLDINF